MSKHPIDHPYVVKILVNGKDIGEVAFRTRENAERFKTVIYPGAEIIHRTVEGAPISAYVFIHEDAFYAGTYKVERSSGHDC